jgi:hypothetical protein
MNASTHYTKKPSTKTIRINKAISFTNKTATKGDVTNQDVFALDL